MYKVMDDMVYFTGIFIVVQSGQRHTSNGQLFEVIIGLRLYGIVWCRKLPDHIDEGDYILTKNGWQVVFECPVPYDSVLVPF